MIYNTMYVEGSVNGFSRLFQEYGTANQVNPPFLTQLPTSTVNGERAADRSRARRRTGYRHGPQGVIP